MYILKYKNANIFSLLDVLNQTLSFGSYDLYYNQGELQCCYDYLYLNKKYNDNSLTKDNVTKALLSKCFNRYFLSSFALSYPLDKDRLRHLYETYCNSNGFIIVYSIIDVINYVDSRVGFIIGKVKYIDEYFDITGLLDDFIYSASGFTYQSIISKRFEFLICLHNMNKDITNYMLQKTNYPYEMENEVRIIHLPNNICDRGKEHIRIPFIKPAKIIMTTDVDETYRTIIKTFCKDNFIEYQLINDCSDIKL